MTVKPRDLQVLRYVSRVMVASLCCWSEGICMISHLSGLLEIYIWTLGFIGLLGLLVLLEI